MMSCSHTITLEELAIHVDTVFTEQSQSRYVSNMFFDWPQDKVVSVVLCMSTTALVLKRASERTSKGL